MHIAGSGLRSWWSLRNPTRAREWFEPRRPCSYSQSDLDQIALRLNQRPRKTLGFETPESRLHASVASTP